MLDLSQGMEIILGFDVDTLKKLKEFFKLRIEIHTQNLKNGEGVDENVAILGTLLGLHTLMSTAISSKE